MLKVRTVNFSSLSAPIRITAGLILTNLTFSYLLASLDSMSAACILERYIEDLGEGSIEAQPCVYPPPEELANFDYNVVKKHIQKLYYPPERGK